MSLLITYFPTIILGFSLAPSWMCTVKCPFFVTMYYFQPCRLAKSNMPKQNLCQFANVISDGS